MVNPALDGGWDDEDGNFPYCVVYIIDGFSDFALGA
jgi:hypothetical protein